MTDRSGIIRVMSFNIRYDNAKDENNGWKHRKELAADMIRFHRADVVGLQEVLHNQLQDLEAFLPEYGWIGIGRDDGKSKGEFAPVFYLKERFQPLDYGFFWLSRTPGVPGSMGWDAACVRITTWVKFSDKINNHIFYHFNTHFDHEGKEAMRQSAYLLMGMADKIAGSCPVVITGDFNSDENSEVYEILTKKDSDCCNLFKDSRYEAKNGHHGPTFTFHDFKAADIMCRMAGAGIGGLGEVFCFQPSPIDFIFIKNSVKVINHGILSDTWDGRYPSDHMPVVADLMM